MVDRSHDDVLAVLDRCADLRLVSRETDGFQFRHALTRDAVLAELPAAVRTDLARRARRAVEAAHPTLPGPWCQLAAELDLASGEAEEAARLFSTAGRQMIALGALPTASAVLERARALVAGDSKLAVEIDELRTEVAALSGEVGAAFDVGTRLIETLADPARRAQVHLCLAEAASAATAWGRAEEQLACARAFADDEPTAVRIDALSAHVQLGMARSDLAEATARGALQIAEGLRLAEPACQALEVLGRIARTRDLREAESVFTRQLEIASAHGLTLWTVRATHELGTVDLLAGKGRDRLLSARELATAAGSLSTVATIDLQLAASHWLEFDVPACLEAARRCQHAARRWNLGLLLAESLVSEARAHATAGRRTEMELAIAEAAATGRFEPEVEGSAWAVRGLYSLLREDRAGAVAGFDAAVSVGLRAPAVYIRLYSSTWALLRTVQNDGGDQARERIRPLVPVGHRLAGALLGYGDAVAAGRRGHRGEAEAAFTTARSELQSGAGLEPQRHLAERLVAECALANGWGEPVQWLTEAAAFFRGTGHRHLERACRSLLRKAGVRVPRRDHGHRNVPPALAALGITDREADVLALVADGLTNKEIAQRLYISTRTVDKHVERLLAKSRTSRRSELRRLAT